MTDAEAVQDLCHPRRNDRGIDHADHVGGSPLDLLADRQGRLRRNPCLGLDSDFQVGLGGCRPENCITPQPARLRLFLRADRESSQFLEDALNGMPGVADDLSLTVYHIIVVYYVVNITYIASESNKQDYNSYHNCL